MQEGCFIRDVIAQNFPIMEWAEITCMFMGEPGKMSGGLRMFFPACFDYLKEGFARTEVQFKKFCLPVKSVVHLLTVLVKPIILYVLYIALILLVSVFYNSGMIYQRLVQPTCKTHYKLPLTCVKPIKI